MRVLVGCEFSGVVREAFRARGHDAWSCDILPAEDGSPFHFQESLLPLLHSRAFHFGWELLIAHPPCTRLTVAGARWFKGREQEQADAIAFVESIWRADIPRICIENPIGVLSTRSTLGKPAQIIQPWQFGHDASKSTCLWLKNLPPLRATSHVEPRMVSGLPRWANQTDSGQNRLPPSPDRWAKRAETYQGIAEAMAAQWGTA